MTRGKKLLAMGSDVSEDFGSKNVTKSSLNLQVAADKALVYLFLGVVYLFLGVFRLNLSH